MRKAFTAFVVLIGLLGIGGGVLTVSAIAADGPLNVVVTDNTHTDAIRFTWDDNPAAGSGRINGVVILYRLKGASNYSKLANVADGFNEYMWYGAPPGIEYEFRLGYCGASDDMYLCDEPWVYLWTPGIFPGTRQLTTPSNFYASDGTVGNGISLNWDDHPQQGEANFRYQIWSSTTPGGIYVLGPGVSTSNHLDTTMDPLEHRYYKVYACIDRCSGFAYDGGQRGLDKPENLIIDHDINGVYLDWDYVPSAEFYVVYRSPLDPVSWTLLGQPSVSAYPDLTGDLNVEYQYRIKACSTNNGLCSAYTYGNGMRGITAPSLKANPANPFIQLGWKHTDVGETTEYRIWRAPKSMPLLRTLIAIQPLANGNSYLDTGADEGVEYIYQLKACQNATSLTCSNAATAVAKWNTCYQLTINVVGSGAVPSVDPTYSAGCPGNNSLLFSEGDQLNFYDYTPSFGWKFDHWIGTYASNSDVAFMPAGKHTVTAVYKEIGADPIELLSNNSIETELPADWMVSRGIESVDGRDCSVKHAGSCSWQLNGNGTEKRVIYHYRPDGFAGDTFNFSIWRKGVNTGGAGYMVALVRIIHKDGSFQEEMINFSGGTVSAWEQRTASFSALEDYQLITVSVTYKKPGGTLWVDDVSLVKNSGLELMVNPSFELSMPEGWSYARDHEVADGRDCTVWHTGSCAWEMNGNGIEKRIVYHHRPDGSAGDAFSFSIWRKGLNTGGAGYMVALIRIIHQDGSFQETMVNLSGGDLAAWEQRTASITANENYQLITVSVAYKKPGGTLWVDDINMVQLP